MAIIRDDDSDKVILFNSDSDEDEDEDDGVEEEVFADSATLRPTSNSFGFFKMPRKHQCAPAAVPASRSSEAQEQVKDKLVTPVISSLLEKSPGKTRQRLTTAQIDKIIKRVSDKLRRELSHLQVQSTLKKGTKKITKAVSRDLVKHFGSAEEALKVAMSPKPESFDCTIVIIVAFHVDVHIHRPKSAVARFFSAVGKTFRKLFSRTPPQDSST